jgi:hypothetical protein
MRKRPLAASAVSKFCIVGSFSSCSDVQVFQEKRPFLATHAVDPCGQDFLIRRSITAVSHACRLSE